MYKPMCLVFLLHVLGVAHGGVLIWGSESIQLPSLKQFNNEDFDLLKSYMRRPKVVVFRGDPMEISSELQDLLRNKYTAYVPSSNLNVDNMIELKNDAASNFKLIQDTLDNCSRENDNILALILTNHEAARPKREASDEFTTDVPEAPEVNTEPENYKEVTGEVLYWAEETTTGEIAMIYSSRTPALKINATTYDLGMAGVMTADDRIANDKYRQLSVTISMASGDKVILRFKFLWNFGYWYLNTIHLLYMSTKSATLVAETKDKILAPSKFSYHCGGSSVFRDEDNDVELTLYDVQAQPDASEKRFDDAYDCVNFTTVPIWSGLFVVSILLSALAIGLGMLNSIKTMDKFDNSKTKPLSITTSE